MKKIWFLAVILTALAFCISGCSKDGDDRKGIEITGCQYMYYSGSLSSHSMRFLVMNNTDNPVHWIGCTFKLYDDKTMIYSNHIEFGSKTYKNMEIPAHGTQYTPWISQTVPISESYTYYPDNLEYYTINE